MYKYTRGLKEWTIDKDAFLKEFIKKCKLFNINPLNVKFYSQQNEDKYIIQYLLKNKIEDGTYLEIGACNGILASNTKTLEDYYEMLPDVVKPTIRARLTELVKSEELHRDFINYRSVFKLP